MSKPAWPKRRNFEPVLMYLEPAKADALRDLAKSLNRPVAELVREAVDGLLRRKQ